MATLVSSNEISEIVLWRFSIGSRGLQWAALLGLLGFEPMVSPLIGAMEDLIFTEG